MQRLPVQHAILCESALQQLVVARYGLKKSSRCRLFMHSQNDIYLFSSGAQRWYFKVYQYGRSVADVQAEIDLLLYLARSGVRIAPPLVDTHERWVVALDDPRGARAGALFGEATGSARGPNTNIPLTTRDMRAFGALIGELYHACDSYPGKLARPHLDFSYLIARPRRLIRPFMASDPGLWHDLKQMSGQLRDKITALVGRQRPEYGICHGDLHAGNLHFADHNAMTLFDFDSCGYGWRAYDIAKIRRLMLWFAKSSGERRRDDQRWQSFLKGYTSVRSLSAQELAAIPAFIPLHHLWWISLKIEMAAQVGCKDLDMDFFRRQVALMTKWV